MVTFHFVYFSWKQLLSLKNDNIIYSCFLLDADYNKFLEFYNGDEEKFPSNPETLLEEIEAKTKELSCELLFKLPNKTTLLINRISH